VVGGEERLVVEKADDWHIGIINDQPFRPFTDFSLCKVVQTTKLLLFDKVRIGV
jgi:hypothetical protein